MAWPDDLEKINADLIEIGSSGLRVVGGRIDEEPLRELRGLRGVKTLREMAENDPVIGAVLFAMETLIRQVGWHMEPASEDGAALAVSEMTWTSLHDMSMTFANLLSSALTMLTYGWAYHELVYKKRMGPDTAVPSAYDDGLIGWRKITPRGQETLYDWDLDDSGGIRGMRQLDPYASRGIVTIPIEKSLLFRTTWRKGNPEGRSILRNAYRPWFFKKRLEEIEAIGVERDLAGLPVAWVPPGMLSKNATADEKDALEEMKKVVRRIKRDEQEGVVWPLEHDAKGNKRFDLTLMSAGGQRQFSTDEIITRYDQRIAMTVLGDFILLGHEKVGSFALGATKIDLFSVAIGAWLDEIADVMNTFAIPRLVRLNGWPVQWAPKLRHAEVKRVDLKELGDYITSLAGVGYDLVSDTGLEEHLRNVAALPRREGTEEVK
ncbi:MAG: phage portal protein family protein [Vicinamibacterales bacterium]